MRCSQCGKNDPPEAWDRVGNVLLDVHVIRDTPGFSNHTTTDYELQLTLSPKFFPALKDSIDINQLQITAINFLELVSNSISIAR